jgi:OHCU decarboxylase
VSTAGGLARLNALPREQAVAELMQCCGAHLWAEAMASARPFPNRGILLQTADALWHALTPEDWLEAFEAHPRIGERAAAHAPAQHAQWSTEEQSGTREASNATMDEIATLNREYEERFGHVFLICATGRSADEMLAALRQRIHHSPAEELRTAAEEQRRIMRIRLEKML